MDRSPDFNSISMKAETVASYTAAAPVIQSHTLDPWAFLHRKLKGRYKLAVLLGVFAAAAGAVAGWRLTQPLFRAEALLRIASTLPPVLEQTDQNQPMPMFDSFLQAQQMTISSPRVVRLAMETPQWRAVDPGASAVTAAGVQAFRERIAVDIRPRSDVIRVSFTDIHPQAAAGGANAVIAAYQQAYVERETEMQTQRLATLKDRRDALIRELADRHAQLDQAGARLAPLHTTSLQRLTLGLVAPPKKQGAEAGAPRPEEAATDSRLAAPAVPPVLVPEQIAFQDPIMRRYLEEKQRDEDQLDEASATLGPAHYYVLKLQRSLARSTERIREYAEAYSRFNAAKSAVPGGQLPEIQQPGSPDPEALAALMLQALRVERLRGDAEQSRKELLEVTRRMNILGAESTLGTRLSVISHAEAPLAPQIDRRLRAAAAGGAAGFCFPAGILILLRLGAVRYRSCDDAAQDLVGVAPLFAVLPATSKKFHAAAAHAMHHIRARLHAAQAGMSAPAVYLVTSPTSGGGKTSIALSLAISFAASGSRTLLIDGDLINRGLSTLLDATESPGLCESLRDQQFLNRVSRTTSGLFVLSAGKSSRADAYALSRDSIQLLISEARKHYDTILIDSSALLGCIEASVLAPHVSGVILTVARGEEVSVVARSLRHLQAMGAKIAAVIFNKATSRDFLNTLDVSAREDAFGDCDAVPVELLARAVLRSTNPAHASEAGPSLGVRVPPPNDVVCQDDSARLERMEMAKVMRGSRSSADESEAA